MIVLPLVMGDKFNNHFARIATKRTADFTAIYVPKARSIFPFSATVCGVTYWSACYQPRKLVILRKFDSGLEEFSALGGRQFAFCRVSQLPVASVHCIPPSASLSAIRT
jgi:hypothetical protein